MKKLVLLFVAASFLAFPCVSAQERPEPDQIEEEASAQDASSMEENSAASADAGQAGSEEGAAARVASDKSAADRNVRRAQGRPRARRISQSHQQAPLVEHSQSPQEGALPSSDVEDGEQGSAEEGPAAGDARRAGASAQGRPGERRPRQAGRQEMSDGPVYGERAGSAPGAAESSRDAADKDGEQGNAEEEPAAGDARRAGNEPAQAVAGQSVQSAAGESVRPRRRTERSSQGSTARESAAAEAAEAAEEAGADAPLFSDPLPAPSVTEVAAEEDEIAAQEEAAQEEEKPPVEPSRTVFLVAGQSLEVWYPGRGWSFEGFRESEEPSSGIDFSSRRFEDGDTLFFFRSSRPGSFILDFSRFDIPTGRYIEDALAVEVFPQGSLPAGIEQAVVRPDVVRAPDYEGLESMVAAGHSARVQAAAAMEDEADAATAEAAEREAESGRAAVAPAVAEESASSAAPVAPAPVPAPAVEEDFGGDIADEPSVMPTPSARQEPAMSRQAESAGPAAPAQVSSTEEDQAGASLAAQASQPQSSAEGSVSLSDIRAMIESGDIDGALVALDRFFAESALDTDEALFLQGQAYEADSPRRDMRRALSAYETLTQAYPLSRFWQDADRRIHYIRRFYIDMR